jgi:hypothetical protein
VKRKGGKCQRCGYDKCIQSLVFHHRDPNQKSFGITEKLDTNYEELIKEVKKCDLLCGNCHGEKHCTGSAFCDHQHGRFSDLVVP